MLETEEQEEIKRVRIPRMWSTILQIQDLQRRTDSLLSDHQIWPLRVIQPLTPREDVTPGRCPSGLGATSGSPSSAWSTRPGKAGTGLRLSLWATERAADMTHIRSGRR